MSHIGMHQPKQKDGKNWKVDYTVTMDGQDHAQSRKFRVLHDATIFITHAKAVFKANPRVTAFNFSAPHKI